MKILVTGASGFTGSHVVQAAIADGMEVIAYVRKSSDLSRLKHTNPTLVYGDIVNSTELQNVLKGVNAIIHTAAYVDLGIVDEKEMFSVNVVGTQNLLDAALDAGVHRFVHCSTIGIFGDPAGEIVNEQYKRTQIGFSSCYDQTKFEAQQLVDQYNEKGLETISVLPSGIMGKGDPHFGPVVEKFLAGKLPLWAGNHRITGIAHVEDIAKALLLALTKGIPGEKYIASAGELTTGEMFQILSERSQHSPPREMPELIVRLAANIMEIPGRIFSWNPPLSRERVHYLYDRCVRVDNTKIRKDLGWNPQTPEETVKRL